MLDLIVLLALFSFCFSDEGRRAGSWPRGPKLPLTAGLDRTLTNANCSIEIETATEGRGGDS
jgi:hypothetical protein